MYKKIFLIAILFIITGEIMIRLDMKFKFFEDTRVVKIATDLKITPEYNMLIANKINFSGNNLRIMVIGDSYIAGGGIEAKDRFSQQLKLILEKNNKKYDDIFVLDVSKPSSNTLDNNQTYFHFVDSFKPHIIILGYNLNDVEGNLEKQKGETGTGNSYAVTNSNAKQTFIKKVYKIYKKSEFMNFVFHKLHTELKAHGVIFPNSEFDLTLKSYYQDKENWKKSKLLLQEVTDDAKKKNIQLIVLKFPEINLIEYPQLFLKTETIIRNFYNQSPSVLYINGSEIFNVENSKDYMLSKYDGHPNEKAHKKMAVIVSKLINTSSQ